MRVVCIHDEEEGLSVGQVRGRLQEPDALTEDPRGEPVLLTPAVLGVGEVLEHDLFGVRGVGSTDERLFYPPVRGRRPRHEEVPFLAPDPLEGAESPVETVGGPELVEGVGDKERLVVLLQQYLRKRRLLIRYRLPAPERHVVFGYVPEFPAPEREAPESRVDTPPGWYGRDRLGIRVGEEEALLGEGVEVRGLYPAVAVGADVVFPQGVYYHQDYVQDLTASIDMLSRPSVAAADYTARPGRYRHALSAADRKPTPSSLRRQFGP